MALALGFVSLASFAATWFALGGELEAGQIVRAPGVVRALWLARDAADRCVQIVRERLAGLRREEAANVADELPEMIDIVNLGLEAGLSFDASLAEYCEESNAGLAREMHEALASWQLGLVSRADALSELARRLDDPSLARFASSVTEALELGRPLAATLARQAALAREEQRARVEERIERVPVKMLVPMGTLVVPAMLIAIVGPLAVAMGM